MSYLDPELMGVFCRKICNPANLYRVYSFLRGYRFEQLRSPAGAYSVVDGLSGILLPNHSRTKGKRSQMAHVLWSRSSKPRPYLLRLPPIVAQ